MPCRRRRSPFVFPAADIKSDDIVSIRKGKNTNTIYKYMCKNTMRIQEFIKVYGSDAIVQDGLSQFII